jgi:hypothetical protein
MKLFLFILFITALVQTSFIPLNLCLILLIARSYAVHNSNNYYLALLSGILLGVLTSFNIGFYAILFVLAVFLIHLIRLLPITGKFYTVWPVTFVVLSLAMVAENFVYHSEFNWWHPVIGAFIAVPVFIFVREWEERFVAKPGIKLKYK